MVHNSAAVPRINVSLNEREQARLHRLMALRGTRASRTIADALTHMLASMELRHPIELVVPSEKPKEGEG